MISARAFLDAASERGFKLYSGVPCSYLTPFINDVIGAGDLTYVGAANEGDAIAIAAGAELAGVRAVAMFQNSGLGNAVNPLTSLTYTFQIPILVIVTWRGQPGGAPDEPQHELMGEITPGQLELMGIPWAPFPTDATEIGPALARAVASMDEHGRPYAFVMSKGSVEPCELRQDVAPAPGHVALAPAAPRAATATRGEMLAAAREALAPEDVVVATTGFTGRELYAAGDAPGQLYMVGSMGCAVSLGLGIAIARPDRRVVVFDGDGAALMRLGALATVGNERPRNLVHVLLDNGRHESTGGQRTVSHATDLAAVAAACGYANVERVTDAGDLRVRLAAEVPGPRFLHVRTRPGVPDGLPRPTVTPAAVAERLRRHLRD